MIIRPVRQRLAGACRLRSALLTSISMTSRRPSLRSSGRRERCEVYQANLLATIIDEAERLNRFIANLLDMTKLESGAIVPNAAMHDLGEIMGNRPGAVK